MKKSIYKSILLFTAVLMVLFFPANALAENSSAKEEVVYVNLKDDGAVGNIYVVNAFDITKAGTVTDYGTYTDTRNLSTEGAISVNGDTVTFDCQEGRFYYQGTLESKPLPWIIGIKYTLDGKDISASDLPGKTGKLEIHLSVKDNKDADEVFIKHYALQTSVKLDTSKCNNITADGATMADSGSTKLLTYTILPEQEKDITIAADVTDFTMDGISFNGIPLTLNIDKPDTTDIKNQIHDLQDGVSDLDDGAKDVASGSGDLYTGAKSLYSGAKKLESGILSLQTGAKTLNDGITALQAKSDSLNTGSAQIKAALDQINAGLSALSGIKDQLTQLKDGSSKFLQGIQGMYSSIKGLPGSSGNIYDGIKNSRDVLEAAMANDSDMDLVVGALKKSSTDPNVQALIAAYTAKSNAIKTVHGGLSALADNYKDFNNGVASAVGGVKTLSEQYETIDAGIQAIVADGLLKLASGIQTLDSQYAVLDGGITQYTGAFSQIAVGYDSVYSGINSLLDGIKELKSGAKKVDGGADDLSEGADKLSDGTGELKDKTSDMDSKVDDAVSKVMDKFTGTNYTLKSFVSDKNTNVKLVQFVIKTEDITEPEKTIESTNNVTTTPSLLDKIKALFQ